MFTKDHMYIFASIRQNLYLDKPITNEELSKLTWIIREEGSGTRKITEQFLRANMITPNRIPTFGSTQIIREAVESGLGISLISEWAIKKELQLGTVNKLTVKQTPVERNFSIIINRQEFESKTVLAFKTLIKN